MAIRDLALTSRLKKLCKDGPVVIMILISAVLVTGTRTIAPFKVGKDQAIQLEASQRLVKGLGLTTTKAYPRESYDILVAPPSKYLTHWPPGFSLLVAVFLYAGLPLLVALKMIYGTITLIGWMGWAIIAGVFVSRPVGYGKRVSWIHLIIVGLLPMVATPEWGGTDVFLWAGIPFVFLCLLGVDRNQPSLRSVACAGFLVGSLYAIRFTSLFLGLAAGMILFQVSYPQIKTFLKRSSVFLLSALTVILPVTIYLMRYVERVTRAAAVDVPDILYNGILIKDILRNLFVTSNVVLGHPLLELVVYRVRVDWLTYSSGLICLIVVLAWPGFLWRGAAARALKAKDDMALSLSLLPVSMVIFLLTIGVYTRTSQFVLVRRYYEVVGLCGLFICYELATKRAALGIVKIASKGILLFFIIYVCVVVPALASTENGRRSLATYAGGFMPSRIFGLYTPRENARAKVERLYKDHPEALFYAHYYQWFIYDGSERLPQPGTGIRAVPEPGFWRRAYASRPVKVFWVLDQKTPLDSLPDSNKQLIFSDPTEEMQIFVSDFPSGPLVSDEQIAEKGNSHFSS